MLSLIFMQLFEAMPCKEYYKNNNYKMCLVYGMVSKCETFTNHSLL